MDHDSDDSKDRVAPSDYSFHGHEAPEAAQESRFHVYCVDHQRDCDHMSFGTEIYVAVFAYVTPSVMVARICYIDERQPDDAPTGQPRAGLTTPGD